MSNSLRTSRIVLGCKSVFQEAVISHRVLMRLIGLIVLALLAPMVMLSQATQLGFSNSPPSFDHGHDYIQQFNETVNPADGSLTLRIGVPTPPGRGLNFPYALTYNSSSIHGFYQPPTPGPGQGGPMLMQWAYPYFIATTAQGWSDTLPRLVAQHTPYFEGYTNPYGDQSIYTVTCEGWQGLQFTDLNGQVHQPKLSASFTYDESTDCNTATPGTYSMAADGTVQGYVQVGGFADFAAPDGTFYEYALSSGLAAGPVNLFPLFIEDRNGNKLMIGNSASESISIGGCGSPCTISPLTVTDTLGRAVISLQPVDASHESLRVSGIPNPYTITFASGSGSTGTAIPQASYNYATGSTANTIPAMPALPGGISSLGLPDGGSYSFSYDPVFGNVNKVTYPNGGTVSYTWGFPAGYSDDANYSAPYIACTSSGCGSYAPASQQVYVQYSMPVILSRTVSFDGQNAALTQTFNYQTTFRQGDMIDGWISKTTTVTTNDLIAGTTSSVIYSYSPFSEMAQNLTQRYTGQTAQEYQAVYKDGNGNVLQTVCKSWIGDADLLSTQTTILPNGMVSEHVFSYGGIGAGYGYVDVPNGDDYYDFSAPQANPTCANPQVSYTEPTPGPLLTSTRQNLTTATTSLYPYGPSIVNTPSSTITKDGSGNTVAETDYQYTNAIAQTVSGVVQHDTAFDSSSQVRQNLLSATKQCFPSCTSVTTTYSYDNTGQVVSATDGRGNTTNYSYADTYAGNAGQPSSVTNAYVTTVTAPSTFGAQHIQRASYGFNDGRIRSTTDENSNATTYCYWTNGCSGNSYDPWMRLTQIQYPDGGSKSATYNDAGSSPTVVSSTVLTSSSTLVQTAIGDGMGHVIHSQTNSDPEGTTTVDTVYGGTGAVFSTSNPYRSTGDSTYGITSYTYDGLGRKILQRQPDGSLLQWCYNGIASSSAQTICTANKSTLANTTWVDAADEMGHHAQQVSDGTGRLVAVMEPDPGSNIPALETDYTYSALSDLVSVTQKGTSTDTARLRSFSYDSLSRLTSSQNPETGTQTYSYNNGAALCAGNPSLPCSKTDARGVTLSYTYDALNRLTFRTASDGSPIAAFGYDGTNEYGTPLSNSGITSNNAIGRLSLESNQANAGAIYSYDAMGRVVLQNTFTPSLPSWGTSTSAQYDLAGNLTSLTYPDGRIVSQGFDGAGRLSSVGYQGWTGGQVTPSNYLTVSGYDPAGHVTGTTMGNSTQMSAAYNNRLEISSLAYAQPVTGSSYWSKGYAWTPNGNLSQATDYVQGTIRQFGYDSLNRLTSAQDVTTAANAQGQVTNTSVQQNDNTLQNSEQIGSAGWGALNALLTANAVAAPDGSMSAGVFAATQNSSDSCVTDAVPDPSLYDGAAVTGSVWLRVRSGTLNTGLYIINYVGPQWSDPGYQPITLTTQWQQFNVSGTNGNGLTSLLLQVGGAGTVTNGQIVEMWGASLQTLSAGSTTNILPSSQQIMGSSWGINEGTVAGNSDTAPDNSYTATTLTATAGSNDTVVVDDVANPAPFSEKQVTGSVYVRSPGGTQSVNLYIVDAGANGYGIVNNIQATLTPNWQRFDMTGTTQPGLTTLLLQVGGGGSLTSGNTIELWGAQMTVGPNEGGYVATATTTTSPGGQTFTLAPSGLNESYSYDSFGNIQQMGNFGFEQAYTPENRLWGYAYDAAGNLLTDRLTNTMTYNANEQVATLNGTTYTYLPSGDRVAKSGAAATDYVYFGGRPIARYSGGQWTDMVYGAGGLLAEVPGTPAGVPEYRMLDHLGTEIGSISAAGQVTINDYAPFGQAIGGTDSDPYKFTGKERDTESGLDYFGARYYASNMGRWMSPDWSAKAEPVPYSKLDNPQTLNLYNYMRNNPLGGTDPDGHCGEDGGQQCSKNLTQTQVTNIVYNETQSLSGPQASDARRDVAHAIINGDNAKGDARPSTASDKVSTANQQTQTYKDTAADVKCSCEEAAKGVDPTNGSQNFNLRPNDSTKPFQGADIQTQSGPLNNSYPTPGLPKTGIYVNTYLAPADAPKPPAPAPAPAPTPPPPPKPPQQH